LNPHGKYIVDFVSQSGFEGLGDFIKLWRSNFIDGMQPKYLPQGWRVDHTVERSFGAHSKFNKNALTEEEEKEETD